MKSIKTKITVSLLIITVIYTLVLSLNLFGLNQINTSYQDVIDRRLVIQNNMQEVLVQSKSQMLAVRGSLITNELNNEEQFEQATNRIE